MMDNKWPFKAGEKTFDDVTGGAVMKQKFIGDEGDYFEIIWVINQEDASSNCCRVRNAVPFWNERCWIIVIDVS